MSEPFWFAVGVVAGVSFGGMVVTMLYRLWFREASEQQIRTWVMGQHQALSAVGMWDEFRHATDAGCELLAAEMHADCEVSIDEDGEVHHVCAEGIEDE